MKPTPLKKGFTLIEIVIVLAIAALIMVIVFVAVQGAQRARRDTATKNDVNRILALAENFASANSGKYPISSDTAFQTDYVNKEFGTNKYVITYAAGAPASSSPSATGLPVNFDGGGTCAGTGVVLGTGTGVSAATRLEVGIYCQNT